MVQRGFNTDDLDRRLFLLEKLGTAHKRACRTHPGDKEIDFAVCLLQDLRSGRMVMGQGVVGIIELIGHEVHIPLIFHDMVRPFDGAIGAVAARGQL